MVQSFVLEDKNKFMLLNSSILALKWIDTKSEKVHPHIYVQKRKQKYIKIRRLRSRHTEAVHCQLLQSKSTGAWQQNPEQKLDKMLLKDWIKEQDTEIKWEPRSVLLLNLSNVSYFSVILIGVLSPQEGSSTHVLVSTTSAELQQIIHTKNFEIKINRPQHCARASLASSVNYILHVISDVLGLKDSVFHAAEEDRFPARWKTKAAFAVMFTAGGERVSANTAERERESLTVRVVVSHQRHCTGPGTGVYSREEIHIFISL